MSAVQRPAAARWLRRQWRAWRAPGPPAYRPSYDDATLHRALARAGGGDRTGGDAGSGDGVAGAGALDAARRDFGARFFVAPGRIPALHQRLGERHPDWLEAQRTAVDRDRTQGLAVYASTGPRLTADFPWADLPPGPGGDTMYAKRPHRFAFAPRHALACHDDPAAGECLGAVLDGWLRCAARNASPWCYDSNLGVIQRVFALSWAWAFLIARGDAATPAERACEWSLLHILRADVAFLEPRLGRSAPNNHLLADRFAAWYLRHVLPWLCTGREPIDPAAAWRDELLRQTYPDGGGFEHALHYHEFACEMGASYLLLCRRQRQPADPAIRSRVAALLAFQSAVTGPEGDAVALGNGVEDTLFPLDPGEGACAGALRELDRALFRPWVSPAPAHDTTASRAYWLLAGGLAPPPVRSQAPPRLEAFAAAGIDVLAEPEHAARLLFRSAPRPGVAVAPGHMHADALSIAVSVGGAGVIVDPGTYSYRATLPWRSHFAGPAAHNGLFLPGHDPLGPLTRDFRSTGADLRAVTQRAQGTGLSLIDTRLEGGGIYAGTRRTCIHVHGDYWLLLDRPTAAASEVEGASYGLQLAAGADIAAIPGGHRLRPPGSAAALHVIASTQVAPPHLYTGSLEPLAGWVAPRYGELVAAPCLRFPLTSGAEASALLLQPESARPTVQAVALYRAGEGGVRIHVHFPNGEDLLLYNDRAGATPALTHGALVFSGRLAWVRRRAGEAVEARWLPAGGDDSPPRGLPAARRVGPGWQQYR